MTESNIPKIALAAGAGLGDGLIELILANNLSINGFDVTFYSNPVAQFGEWLPRLKVKSYREVTDQEKEFAAYDLVLADNISILSKPHWRPEDFPMLAKKYVYIGFGKVEKELIYDHTERLRGVMTPEMFTKCAPLAAAAGEIRYQGGDHNITQVKSAAKFCSDVWKLPQVETSIGMMAPEHLKLKHRGHSKRIVISPFSANPVKDWPLKKFIVLAEKLRHDGFEPVFAVAPPDMERLQRELCGRFPAPDFPSIGDLAAYVYESVLTAGNDSGTGHLASCLGIPTVTVSSKKNHRWRPDWSDGLVVLPLLKLKLGRKRYWKPFLSVGMVYRAVCRMVG